MFQRSELFSSVFLSLCYLQLPESVLRIPGRGERHHGRDQGEAHPVSLGICPWDELQLVVSSACVSLVPVRSSNVHQVQLHVRDVLSERTGLLHRLPALL